MFLLAGEPESNSVKDNDAKKKRKGAKAGGKIEEGKDEGADGGDGES